MAVGSRSGTRACGYIHCRKIIWGAPLCCSGVGRRGIGTKSPSSSRGGGGWSAKERAYGGTVVAVRVARGGNDVREHEIAALLGPHSTRSGDGHRRVGTA